MVDITAIIPTFNRAALVGECIRSVLDQTRRIDEIIVVNDGSTDDTLAALARFGDAITVIDKPNGGKSSALNLALERAKGEHIWICDDDDVAHPEGAALLRDALARDPDAPFAYGNFEKFWNADGTRRFEPQSYFGRSGEQSFLIKTLEEMYAFQFAILARRDAYLRAGPFREDLIRSQDFEMLTRLAQLGDPAYVPHTIFYQRQHQGARGSAEKRFDGVESHAQAIRFGGKVLLELRDSLPPATFTPSFARSWGEGKERAAMLQRGLVLAQRSLWREATEDLAQASALGGNHTSTVEERALAQGVVRNVVPWRLLYRDRESMARLARIGASSAYGRQILASMLRPVIWRIRVLFVARRYREAAEMARLSIRLLGLRGALVRSIRNMLHLDL